jgi:putative tricarboxylic transport membrane protein
MTTAPDARPASRADRIAGALLLLAGTGTALEATTFNVAFMTDPVGPKALPFVVAATLVLAGGRMLVRPREVVDLPEPSAALRMAGAAAAFLVYAALLPWIGFYLSTTFVVAVLALLYQGPWRGGLAAGLVLSTAIWLLFVRLLALPLPVGELWMR